MNAEKKKVMRRNFLVAGAFILPFALLYTIFTIWPVIRGIYVSLNDYNLMGSLGFVGLDNYKKFIGDKHFWGALGNTTKFVIMSVPIMIVAALGLALLANRASKLKKFYRICYYLPNVLSVSVISTLAVYMSSPYMGFINSALHALKILPADVEPQWLSDPNLAWVTITVATVWWTVGFSMMLYISALQDIPTQVYEAADIDGASKTRQLFTMTIPLLKNTTFLVLLLQVIAAFKVFGQIHIITSGGPGTSTRPIIQYIYQMAFTENNLGYASAMSYVLFAILIILSVIQLKIQNRGDQA